MCATVDLNSVCSPPTGSPETSTVSFLGGALASVSLCGDVAGNPAVGVTSAIDSGNDSDCFGVGCGVGGDGNVILSSSRSTRCIKPGPRTTEDSFMNPVPVTNQRSTLIDIRDRSSERR